MRPAGILLLTAALALTGCQTAGMQFTRETALTITSPGLREEVALPVAIQWEPDADLASELEAAAGELYYAVFVDRAPLGAGRDIADVVNSNCDRTGGCTDPESLADRGIHTTVLPRLVLDDLDDLRRRGDPDALDIHEVTIVVLRRSPTADPGAVSGQRVGEASYRVEFVVAREGAA